MPSFTRVVAALGTIAAVAAAPQARYVPPKPTSPYVPSHTNDRDTITKRQSHPVDFEEACRMNPPEEGQLGFTTSGGVTVVWDGGNLGNGASDKLVALHDHDCNILDIQEAQPQTPGFLTDFTVTTNSDDLDNIDTGAGMGGVTVSVPLQIAHNWISDGLISEGAVRLSGILIQRWCGGEESGMDGINMGYWMTCNFWPNHEHKVEV